MSIKISSIKIQGNCFLGENRLPHFRDKDQNKPADGSGLLEREKAYFTYQTGRRVLPYLVQDLYSRHKKPQQIKTIEMENDHIKAIFLPQYGMRMISLFDKGQDRELLFRNPVLQFANLAIRDAWFAGGIEWNIGQLGHTFTTSDHLYAAICQDQAGNDFLRCYEYERCKGVYWQIDFHLAEKATYLAAYVRMINPKSRPVPFYWWTNIALAEENQVRVFSGNQEVIYIDPSSMASKDAVHKMSHGQLPYLASLPDRDASYPQNFNFSSEYFFQNQAGQGQSWQAALYQDGNVFYEASSDRLLYRKMFCWGTHQGGQNWKDYLALEGEGDYIELQAGLAPSQMHGIDLPAKTSWDFVQVFGGTKMDPALGQGDWLEAQKQVGDLVKSQISDRELASLLELYRSQAERPIQDFLHWASGFGAIEEVRSPGASPKGLSFPLAAISPKETMWLRLVQDQVIEDMDIFDLPLSYLVDLRYEAYLSQAAQEGGHTAKNLYGVMCYEAGRYEEGIAWFKESIKARPNPLAYRNLFWAYREDQADLALTYMEKALDLYQGPPARELVEEYSDFLSAREMYEKLWAYYGQLPRDLQANETLILNLLPAAISLRKLDFLQDQFQKEFTAIREGNRSLTEAYFAYQALKEAEQKKIDFGPELVEKYVRQNQIPKRLDFRQAQRYS